MSTPEITGPAPVSRVWSGSQVIAEDVRGDDLSDVLELHSEASAWWVLSREDHQYAAAELRGIAEALELDRLAVHELLSTDRRGKFEDLGSTRIVLTNTVTLNADRTGLDVHPVSVVISDRVMICVADKVDGFHPARVLTTHAEDLNVLGVEAALQVLLSAVIDTYEEVVDWIEDVTDRVSESLFDGTPLTRAEQLEAFRARSALTRLRRLSEPMCSVVAELIASLPERTSLTARHWAMISEHNEMVAHAAVAATDNLTAALDTSLSLASVRMDETMKKLTGWAAILAVPTLVTGFVGMNVEFPLDGTSLGFWVYLLIMVAIAAVLYVIFRRRDWI